MNMTRRLTICCDNIQDATDKKYVFTTYELMLDMLLEHDDTVSNLKFDKNETSFLLMFTLKISKKADLIRILIHDYLSTILETEEKVSITIDDIEEQGEGTTYRLYRYKAKT